MSIYEENRKSVACLDVAEHLDTEMLPFLFLHRYSILSQVLYLMSTSVVAIKKRAERETETETEKETDGQIQRI